MNLLLSNKNRDIICHTCIAQSQEYEEIQKNNTNPMLIKENCIRLIGAPPASSSSISSISPTQTNAPHRSTLHIQTHSKLYSQL